MIGREGLTTKVCREVQSICESHYHSLGLSPLRMSSIQRLLSRRDSRGRTVSRMPAERRGPNTFCRAAVTAREVWRAVDKPRRGEAVQNNRMSTTPRTTLRTYFTIMDFLASYSRISNRLKKSDTKETLIHLTRKTAPDLNDSVLPEALIITFTLPLESCGVRLR
jgi:hypothetical protein